jgi:transposase
VGQYLTIAAINRAICPRSKRSIAEWFSQTTLRRHFPEASEKTLSSQRFWDHMDRIDDQAAARIWKTLLRDTIEREQIDVSSISYDGTNFYTFIDTFNLRCELPQRGKNKQGRNNLRQVSYALFCAADGHLPLFYDVYEGQRNDAKQFPVVLRRFKAFFRELAGPQAVLPETTLVFDKGNNSDDNFRLIDELQLKFVGSVKLDQHKDLAAVRHNDPRYVPCTATDQEGTKAFRVKRKVAGRERVMLVTYNQNLFDAQWQTVQNDMAKALEKLAALRQRLEDRAAGLITGGRAPTMASVKKQCQEFRSRQHMKQVIATEIRQGDDGIPRLAYRVDGPALETLSQTVLGKTLLVSNRESWWDERIIRAYRSQYIIENVFKEMKDREVGMWWPLNHWTDSKIRVHGLYCTIALLLRAVMYRRVCQAGLKLSLPRLLRELEGIREVINVVPGKRGQPRASPRTVLTKMSELQQRIVDALMGEARGV